MGLPMRSGVIRSLDIQSEGAAVVVVPAESLQASQMTGQLSRVMASGIHQAAADPLADIRLQAQRMRSEAEADAEALRARAEVDAEAMRRAAREEGYRAGLADARAELERELRDQITAVTVLSADLNALRSRFTAEFESVGLDLAVLLAERILRGEIDRDPTRLGGMLSELIAPLLPLQSLTVRVHPADAALLETNRARLTADLAGGPLSIIEDQTVAVGTLKASFEGGDLDASLDQQLGRLRTELLRSLLPGAQVLTQP